jgi:hypothetical protein
VKYAAFWALLARCPYLAPNDERSERALWLLTSDGPAVLTADPKWDGVK